MQLTAGFQSDQVAFVIAEIDEQRQVSIVWMSQGKHLKVLRHYNGAWGEWQMGQSRT